MFHFFVFSFFDCVGTTWQSKLALAILIAIILVDLVPALRVVHPHVRVIVLVVEVVQELSTGS